jgi:hypothetical protein
MANFDFPSFNELQDDIRSAISSLDNVAVVAQKSTVSIEEVETLSKMLKVVLKAMATSIGECRMAVPFSSLHPVITAEGKFQWCCNHDPQHCR